MSGLKKSFGKQEVLKGINLELGGKSVVALMGPNGSGKTTLLKSILGLVVPTEGSIAVHGEPIRHTCAYRTYIGYMPQIARYPENLNVRQLVRMVADLRGNPENVDNELVDSLRLRTLEDKALGTLSGGQKQRVGACLAFMFHQNIIILDEPTAGLDPVSVQIVKDKIKREKENGKLIIIATHIISETEELADRLVYMVDGNIYMDNGIADILQQAAEERLGKALATIMQSYEYQ